MTRSTVDLHPIELPGLLLSVSQVGFGLLLYDRGTVLIPITAHSCRELTLAIDASGKPWLQRCCFVVEIIAGDLSGAGVRRCRLVMGSDHIATLV